MSTLRVGNITATGGTGTITVPTGNQISQVYRPSGLVLVKTQTIGTAVSSVTVSDAFSADFENYRIIVSGGTASANSTVRMTLGSASANYYWSWLENNSSAAGYNGNAGSNVSSWGEIGLIGTNGHDLLADICQPFSTYRTTVTARTGQAVVPSVNRMYSGMLNDTTSYTAFTLTPASGTLTGGTIRVYGYRNS